MGKIKYLKEVEELFGKSPVVMTRDIKLVVRGGYAYLLLNKLLKQGKIKRLVRGFYTTYEEPTLAVFCFRPAYIGLQDALSIHGLWEQETVPIILSAAKVRSGLRVVLNNNVIIRKLKKKYVFGYEFLKVGDFYIPVSDIEKTFIDLIYFKEVPDRKILKEIVRKMNREKLKRYLKSYPRRFQKKCVGYL